MKSLLEVQQDVRSLEHSINDITNTIKTINGMQEHEQ
jgi:prefoldin subunit 5